MAEPLTTGDAPGHPELLAVKATIHPARVLRALGAIGYTPDTAICDIVDNSVSHGRAKRVWIELVTQPGVGESRRNSAAQYIVADDGGGMDEEDLLNALALGSPPSADDGELGKFGLGLKAAGLSLGSRVTLLSKKAANDLTKMVLDVGHVELAGEYQTLKGPLSTAEKALWDRFLLGSQSGTMVIVEDVHRGNQPSVKATRRELQRKLGVIYFYFLRTAVMSMKLNGEAIDAFDPLFTDDADANGDLDEAEWDGRSVRWLSRPSDLTIDAANEVRIRVEMTQLPHPRVHDDEQAAIRQRYNIGAGRYGFYVYRNRRLISWAERFGDIIPLDQDYYAFRGRIHVDDSADEVLNIDVKKSRVLLSEEAREAVSDAAYEPRRKSRSAWNQAFRRWKQAQGESTQSKVNEQLNRSDEIDDLPSEPDDPEREDRRAELEREDATRHPYTQEERERLLAADERVVVKEFLEDNVVWERAYDPTHGTVVRLNRQHRFMRHVFAHYSEDFEVNLVLSALFLCLARTEKYTITHLRDRDEKLEQMLTEFRRVFAEQLGAITQQILEPALTDDGDED